MPQFESQLNADADKLPTVKQWAASISKDGMEAVRLVKVIWMPNLYDSYSLDTECFRLRVPSTHSLFQVLEDNLEDWLEEGVVLGLQVIGKKLTKVTLMTVDSEECQWDPLGEHGWKMSQLTAKKRTRAKTRLSQTSMPEPQPTEDGSEGLST